MTGRASDAVGRVRSFVRDSAADLFDQKSPFGRLALTHVLMTAGDTLLTVSLAGSLFFSISPDAARRKVLLYLLLTIAPFAVVAPLLAPLIDRSRGARRAMAVFSAAARAGVCLFMVGHLNSLLLFPAAFLMLVLSKVYLVTKGALVPLVAGGQARLPGRAGARPAPAENTDVAPLATLNARLGLLASLSGLAAGIPAAGVLELLGAPWVLRLDVLVFVAATVAALRLPMSREGWGSAPQGEGRARTQRRGATSGVDKALDTLGIRNRVQPEVTLSLTAMSVLKGLVGFLTFLLAFELRQRGVGREWYGFVLGASVTGALVGVVLVAQARRTTSERRILLVSVWLVSLVAAFTALVGGVAVQGLLAFTVGLSAASAKPAFDALVQRFVPPPAQGRAFASFETRLQLAWVIGALVPVIATIPLVAGDLIIAGVAACAGASYVTGNRALSTRTKRAELRSR